MPKKRKEPHEMYFDSLEKISRVIDCMLKKHSKVKFNQFVLLFPNNWNFIPHNDLFVKFINSLNRFCERNNLGFKYIWFRETAYSGNSHQYRVFFLCDGQDEMNNSIIIKKSCHLWKNILNTDSFSFVNFSLTDNGIMIDRNSSDSIASIEKCINSVSYCAKAMRNGFCPSGIRDFGSSRV